MYANCMYKHIYAIYFKSDVHKFDILLKIYRRAYINYELHETHNHLANLSKKPSF